MNKDISLEVAENGFIVTYQGRRSIYNGLYDALKRIVVCAYDSKGGASPSTDCMVKMGKYFIKEFGGSDDEESSKEVEV